MIPRPVLVVAFLFGGLGLIVSRPEILSWVDSQGPVIAFVAWYVLFFAYLQFTSVVIAHRIDLGTLRASVGIVILIFAFGIVDYFPASQYSLIVVGANPAAVPSFLIASEDQLTYVFWNAILPGFPNFWMGILIYFVTPIILVIVAAFVIGPRNLVRSAQLLFRWGG